MEKVNFTLTPRNNTFIIIAPGTTRYNMSDLQIYTDYIYSFDQLSDNDTNSERAEMFKVYDSNRPVYLGGARLKANIYQIFEIWNT